MNTVIAKTSARPIRRGKWMGFCRWRRDETADSSDIYLIPFRKLGVIFRISRDGTPWMIDEKRYLINLKNRGLRLAFRKYALGFIWRDPSKPSDEVAE